MTYPPEFNQLWSQKPNRGPGNNKYKAFKAYSARLKEGCNYNQILNGMLAYQEFCRHTNILNTPYVMQLSTFLGPCCHFKDEWKTTRSLPRIDEELENYAINHGLSKPNAGENYRHYRNRLDMELRV